MARIRRLALVLVSVMATWSLTITSAQSTIPSGVFVRESNGTTWLVLDGQRVGVPVWQATDADIAALPRADRWAVMNDANAIVAGDRPAWLADQPSQSAVSSPASPIPAQQPTSPSPSVATSQSGLSSELIFQRINADKKGFIAASVVNNQTSDALSGVRIRYDALDGSGVVLGSEAETLPTLAPGSTFYHVLRGSARANDAQIQSVRATTENTGKPPTKPDIIPVQAFAVDDVKLTKYDSIIDKNRNAYRVTANVTNGTREVNRFSLSVAYLVRDGNGKVVGAGRDSFISNAPEIVAPGMALRVDSGPVDVDGIPMQAEVQAYREND